MKTTLKTILILVLLLLTNRLVQAQEKKLLRLNLSKGAQYEMATISNINATLHIPPQLKDSTKTEKDSVININLKLNFVNTLLVEDVLPNKNFKVLYGYKSLKVDADFMNKKISFDSDKISEKDSSLRIIKAIADSKLKFEITPLGKIVNIEELGKDKKALSDNPMLAQFLNANNNDSLKWNMIQKTFNYFPEAAIKEGDTWGNVIKIPFVSANIDVDYKVSKLTDKSIDLTVHGKINKDKAPNKNIMFMFFNLDMVGSQNGSITLNTDDGMLQNAHFTNDFLIELKVNSPKDGKETKILLTLEAASDIKTTKI